MAKLLKTNGDTEQVQCRQAGGFRLAELYATLQTEDIEIVHLLNGEIMVVHGSGHIVGLPYNEEATRLYQHGRVMPETIVGDALVCSRREIN